MDGELLRCIAMMRDSNPQVSGQGAQMLNELVSNNKPEAIKAFFVMAGSNEDQMVRSYATVNLIRAIRDCQHDMNEAQKIEVIQQLTGISHKHSFRDWRCRCATTRRRFQLVRFCSAC